MSSPITDIDSLARERTTTTHLARPRRARFLLLPLLLLAAFASLFAGNLRDLLRGARTVRLVRPVPVSVAASAAVPGAVLAQAAGWIEPDPFPAHAPALAEGVVREMLVQESDVVAAGDPLALLIDDDARLALALAEGTLKRQMGLQHSAQADLDSARESFDTAIEVTARLAKARAERAARTAEAELRAAAVIKGHAQVGLASDELLVQRELEAAGAAGPRQVEIAAARVDEARGELALREADAAMSRGLVASAEAELERAARDLELRIEERLRVERAQAVLEVAEGGVAEARAARDTAQLRLDRMVVRAPVAGVVLERRATVGSPLVGMEHSVVTLFDPASVRARVDVPQQDLADLFVGQEARIECDARPGRPYRGQVLRIVQRADVQKVTLQAQVRVLDPDGLLRPEMLVQVAFLAPVREVAADEPVGAGVLIPARLLREGRVWVLDPLNSTAVSREVETRAASGELVIVTRGLDLSDKLIDGLGADLSEGERVREEGR